MMFSDIKSATQVNGVTLNTSKYLSTLPYRKMFLFILPDNL